MGGLGHCCPVSGKESLTLPWWVQEVMFLEPVLLRGQLTLQGAGTGLTEIMWAQ